MFPSGRYPCSKTVKVSRLKYIENIKYCLLILFSRYGNIVDIDTISYGNIRMDAFIFFETRENARNAVLHMQGFRLFGRPMRVRLSTRGDIYFNQVHSNQVVPSSSVEYGLQLPSENLRSRLFFQASRCPVCHPSTASANNQGNHERDLNEAGPSRENNAQPSESSAGNVPVVPAMYPTFRPSTAFGMNRICLYVTNIPGNDIIGVHYVAMSLFQSCIGFQTLHIVPHKRGTVVVTFWSPIQAQLAMSFYDGFKIANNLRLQVRIAVHTIIQHINNPDFDPSPYLV